MKYTIEGFNQKEVLKLGNLDVIDLVILRWIVDFEPNMAKKEIDGEIYFWVNYQSLLEALPILNIQKLALYRRLERMCDSRIFKHKNVKDKGNYSYYSFGDNYAKLISQKIEPSIVEDRTLLSQKIEQNNSSIKEINLLNNSKENIKESSENSSNLEAYKEIVGYMNVVNEHHRFNVKIPFSYKYQSKATQKLINARLREGYDIEEFKDVIWWGYKKFVENEFTTQNGESSYKYFRPSTLFSSEHFEAYLNEYRANTQ